MEGSSWPSECPHPFPAPTPPHTLSGPLVLGLPLAPDDLLPPEHLAGGGRTLAGCLGGLPLTATWTLWLMESWGWMRTLHRYSPSSMPFCTSVSFRVPFSNTTCRWLSGSSRASLYHLME